MTTVDPRITTPMELLWRVPTRQQSTERQQADILAATLGKMEHEIKRERAVDSINKRRDAGKDPGGRPRSITDSQSSNARRLIEEKVESQWPKSP